MSLARSIFARVFNAGARKIRGSEGFWGTILVNWRAARQFLYFGGSVYCTSHLLSLFYVEWSPAHGPSMFPTMREDTAVTLLSKYHANGKDLSPGDIVVYKSPIFLDEKAGKRLIGMQNDFVVLDPDQAPSVGGAPVPGITDWRSSKSSAATAPTAREEPMMVEVPTGHIWTVGDNLSRSRDSRFYGPVPMALVTGKQIMHSTSPLGGGRQWTRGEQLTRIPKEEEEEYLQGYRRDSQTQTQVQGAEASGTTATDRRTSIITTTTDPLGKTAKSVD